MKSLDELTRKDMDKIFKMKKGTRLNVKCECGGRLVIRERFTKFLGCSRYPECKNTYGKAEEKPDYDYNPFASLSRMFYRDLDLEYGEDSWGDFMDQMYPGGIHCSDDM